VKVLHVVPDIAPESGGQSTAAIGLCEGLTGLRIDVNLLTTDYRVDSQTNSTRIARYIVPCAFSPWRWSPTLPSTLKALLSQVQIVHLHGLWLYPIWVAGRLCQALEVPYLLRPCGMLDRWSLSQKPLRKAIYTVLLERRTIRRASAIHFTAEAEQFRSLTFGSSAPSCIVPLGLPREAYEDLPPLGAFRHRFPELMGRQFVLFLGRLHYKKRPDLLLQVFRELVKEFSQAALVLAGPGEAQYVAGLQEQARDLGLGGHVVFPGLLRGRAVQEALVDAAIFVLPSLQENFSLAVAEAMAVGCPVVVSPHVALAKEIQEYSAGLVVNIELDELSNAIRQLLRDDSRRDAMGRNGRQLVLDRFTWNHVARQMMQVYEDVLQGTRTSSSWR
jgi:glycosyltransferase involved in cell wall biosynthesis